MRPQTPGTYLLRAKINVRLKQYDRAVSDATQAIDLQHDPDAYAWRACANIHRHQFERALGDLETAIKLQPRNELALSLKTQVLAQMGRVDEALTLCNLVLTDWPNNVVALTTRANLYQRMHKADLAEQDLAQLKSLKHAAPTADTHRAEAISQ